MISKLYVTAAASMTHVSPCNPTLDLLGLKQVHPDTCISSKAMSILTRAHSHVSGDSDCDMTVGCCLPSSAMTVGSGGSDCDPSDHIRTAAKHIVSKVTKGVINFSIKLLFSCQLSMV